MKPRSTTSSPTSVKNVVIPRTGKPSEQRRAKEHRKPFRRIVKWRTGSEGRISYLKRGYGWDRARIDGTEGTRIWTDTASWPTTWSRSAPWPHDREPHRPVNASCQSDGHPQRTSADPAPSLFQVEVASTAGA